MTDFQIVPKHDIFVSFGTHVEEKQHVTNRRCAGQNHDQTIDADAFSGGRWHVILQRTDVVLVHLQEVVGVGFVFPYGLGARTARAVLNFEKQRLSHSANEAHAPSDLDVGIEAREVIVVVCAMSVEKLARGVRDDEPVGKWVFTTRTNRPSQFVLQVGGIQRGRGILESW